MPGALQHLLVLDLTSHLSGSVLRDAAGRSRRRGDQGRAAVRRFRPRHAAVRERGERAVHDLEPQQTLGGDGSEAGRRIANALLDLIDRADVLMENYRPGVLARLGLGWDVLHQRNPRLILASISGFGQTGPYSSRGGFDLITQAMSGLMSTNGPADGDPFRLPIAISDVTAGMFLAFGVLAAIEARHRTGKGQHVETSLLEAATSLAVYESAHYFATGTRPARIGQAHRGSSPYQCFATADGHITVGASQQHFFAKLCEIVGQPELAPIRGSAPSPIAWRTMTRWWRCWRRRCGRNHPRTGSRRWRRRASRPGR